MRRLLAGQADALSDSSPSLKLLKREDEFWQSARGGELEDGSSRLDFGDAPCDLAGGLL
jgi:hypothetical protein